MKVNLLYLSYNNYFNRIIKKESNLADYRKFSCSLKEQVSFNPNDGIETDIMVNWTEDFIPDYCIVIAENGTILTRWFIKDFVRTRAGQFHAFLRRDVVADHLESILDAKCFVKKGFVSNDNPLIFNREDFACNQIKKNEVLLKDNTSCSWLVLYYNLAAKARLKGDIQTTSEHYVTIGTSKDAFQPYADYKTNGYHRSYNKRFAVTVDSAGTPLETFVTFNKDGSINNEGVHQSDSGLEYNNNYIETQKAIKECVNSNKTQILQKLALQGNESDTFEDFYKWNNVLVKATDNKYYRVVITKESETVRSETTLTNGDLFDALSNAFKTGGVFKSGWSGNFNNAFIFFNYYESYKIDMIEETNAVTTYHFDFSSTRVPKDAPYGIIAMPFKPFNDDYKVEIADVSSPYLDGFLNSEIPLLIAELLCQSGIGYDKDIYDAQLLPYCPNVQFAKNCYTFAKTIFLEFVGGLEFSYVKDEDVTFIADSSNNVVCCSFHPTSCKFTFDIPYTYSVDNYKIVNQCDFIRLCSPNWNGIFEFNPAKNDGVQSINVDCTYKPYQPYIHLNPNFKGLYGKDFDDARGLICGGDFSLSFVSQAWETYKIQNKNYQDIFNRQIENMDANYDIDKSQILKRSVSSMAMGGISSIGAGMLGHSAGAMGGATGGVNAGIGGIINYQGVTEKYQEARDNAIDMHNFQLDNIKALPNSLSKVDSFNNNNKIFPLIEEYSCTDEEKEIFKDKIKYEGMTINAIGKIASYIKQSDELTFIKGEMLRMEDLAEDSHLLYTIYEEIAKGVYL